MDRIKAALGARVEERPKTGCNDKLEGQAINKVLLAGLQRWCLDVSDWDELSPRQVRIYIYIYCWGVCSLDFNVPLTRRLHRRESSWFNLTYYVGCPRALPAYYG